MARARLRPVRHDGRDEKASQGDGDVQSDLGTTVSAAAVAPGPAPVEDVYEPNSFDGPAETNEPHYGGLDTTGVSGTYEWDRRETDDFAQAGALYSLIDDAAKRRLVDNIADGLAQVEHSAIVDRSVSCFRSADPDYGDRIERAIAARRG